jgi:hypothetical protein
MDALTFIVGVLNAGLWWPAALVLIVLLLRTQIAERLGELRRLKWKDLEAEFDKGLKQMEVQADKTLPEIVKIETSDSLKIGLDDKMTFNDGNSIIVEGEKFSRLAELSPPAAIVHVWIEVEEALKDVAERHDLSLPERAPTVAIMNLLLRHELLDKETLAILNNLRALRNTAAHARASELNPSQAMEYERVARRLIAALGKL